MMEVLEPLEEEMRMSESISLPNGVSITFQSFYFLHLPFLHFGNWDWKKDDDVWALRFLVYLKHKQLNKLCVCGCNLPPLTCSATIAHSTSPSLWVIYVSVCGRTDSMLYSRPLKPRGDSPCQAAASNEKLKEHINSSIWGHEDENSCQRPARNNWSHNVAPLYVSEVTGVKQQLKKQGSKNTASWLSLIGVVLCKFTVKICLSVSSSKQAINMAYGKLRLECCCQSH